MTRGRWALIAFTSALCAATPAWAQVVVTSFVSANVRTAPGFIDLDDAAKDLHGGFGVAVTRLTDGWFGLEAETGLTPSAFSGHDLVESSRLLTATGSVLAIAPARWGWVVRPYVSFGAGVAHVKSEDVARIFVVNSSHAVATAGIGAWAWIGPRVGIRTSVRFLRTVRAVESGTLETWQPSVGVAIRF